VQTTSTSERALLAHTSSRRIAVKAFASIRLYTFFAGFSLVTAHGTLRTRRSGEVLCWAEIGGFGFVFIAAGSEMLAALDMVEM
jgi:hypothetical protein